MRLALAQLNPLIGDLEGNAARILEAGRLAAEHGAELLLTPELSLWGYPPRDLLLRSALVERQSTLLQGMAEALPEGMAVLVGVAEPVPGGGTPGLWNAMVLVRGGGFDGGFDSAFNSGSKSGFKSGFNGGCWGGFNGRCDAGDQGGAAVGDQAVGSDEAGGWEGGDAGGGDQAARGWRVVVRKRLLPSYDVFDESRYFLPGEEPCLLARGQHPDGRPWRLGLSICEDLWVEQELQTLWVAGADPIGELAELRPDLLLNLSASPYGRGKLALRRQLGQRAAGRAGCPLVYVNQVGGNDELVFDGASFVVEPDGTLLGQGPVCQEALLLWDAADSRGAWRELPLVGVSGAALAGGGALTSGRVTSAPLAEPAAESPNSSAELAGQRLPAVDGAPEALAEASCPGRRSGMDGTETPPEMEQLLRALVLGVGDYARKCGFQGALLGLSGGIDSALVAVIAAAALGADRVKALRLPSPWSSRGSLDDAQALAERLGLDLQTLPIAPLMHSFDQALTPVLSQPPSGVTAENLQSRIRGTLLMALANQQGRLLLSTGNKSELAVGYCTLYGDMNGGLAVIGDLYKTTVFDLCDWIDSPESSGCRQDLGLPPEGELIGRAIRTKPPSAELRPDQKDSDSLPDYAVLDPLLRRSIEAMATPEQLIAEGTEKALAQRVHDLLRRAEFKRRQAPPVLKISSRSFGGGWRMPVAGVG